MAKYIIESYREFRDQYLKIQGEINVLRGQIKEIKNDISKKAQEQSEPLAKSRQEFINMFKPLKSKMKKENHLDKVSGEPFFYRMYFSGVDKREEILKLLEEVILVFEDISSTNNDLKLVITVSVANDDYSRRLLLLRTEDETMVYSKNAENIKGKEMCIAITLLEYGLDMEFNEDSWNPKSPSEIVSLLNKLEDVVEKGENFSHEEYLDEEDEDWEEEEDDYEEEEEEEDDLE